jgi:outer membrane protein W
MLYNLKSAQTLAQGWKSSIFAATSSILTAALILLSVSSARAAEEKQNYVAPSIGFVNGSTLYGVNAKFGLAENISLRPFIQYKNSGGGTGTAYGASVTYNFQIPSSKLIPYLGIGAAEVTTTGTASGNGGIYFEGGVDYNASDNFVINANYKSASSTWINIGAGYRF